MTHPTRSSPAPDVPFRAGRREWTGLAVLALPTLLLALDMTVLSLAIPALTADLRPSSSELLWILDIYGFLIAGSLITMGGLGDRIGRRRLMLIGAAAFGLMSVLAAFSTSAGMLIATRALLGIAGATLMPSTLSLIRTMFRDPAQRTVAIAVWMSSFMVGAAVGPLIGGAFLEIFWWGSVFLLGVPVMLVLLVVGPVLLPESRDRTAGRVDLLSAALSVAAVLGVVYGIKQYAENGLGWLPVVAAVTGLGLGAAFVHRQRTYRNPLVDLTLFSDRTFGAALSTQTLTILAMGGSQFFVAQYLQLVVGLTPLQAGLWTLPMMAASLVGAMVAPALVTRIRPASAMSGGLLLAVVGFAVTSLTQADGGLPFIVTGSVLLGIGLGPAMTLTTDLMVGTASPERAGAASAISETGSELGMALGVAVIGSVGTAVYRGQIGAAMPDGLSPEAAEAATGTLGAAVAVAGRLPDQLGSALLDGARTAFTAGLQVSAIIGAAIALAVAGLAAVMLRQVPPNTRPAGGEPAAPTNPEAQLVSEPA